MSKKQFRWLLTGYIVVVIMTILTDYWTASLVPDTVKQLEPSTPIQSLPLRLLMLAFILCLLGAALVGIFGMFFFWAPARYVYLVGVLLKILLSPILAVWSVDTGWETLFVELELFLDGVILTLCILGPAKDLFEKRKESNQALDHTA